MIHRKGVWVFCGFFCAFVIICWKLGKSLKIVFINVQVSKIGRDLLMSVFSLCIFLCYYFIMLLRTVSIIFIVVWQACKLYAKQIYICSYCFLLHLTPLSYLFSNKHSLLFLFHTFFFQFLWPNILAAVSRSMSEHIFKAQLQEPHIIYYSTAYDLISWDVTVSEDASSCHASLQMESMRFHYKGLLSSSAYDS